MRREGKTAPQIQSWSLESHGRPIPTDYMIGNICKATLGKDEYWASVKELRAAGTRKFAERLRRSPLMQDMVHVTACSRTTRQKTGGLSIVRRG